MLGISKVGLIIGGITGAVGIVMSALSYRKTEQLAKKMGMTIDDLSNKTSVDIKEAVIDKAVQKAVDRDVGLAISLAANNAVSKVAADMQAQIRKPVSESYANIEKSVSDEIARQVEKLDIETLKHDVTEKAKTAILKKFDGSLDDVLREFSGNLNNVAKVYGAIAGSAVKQQDRGFVIKLA